MEEMEKFVIERPDDNYEQAFILARGVMNKKYGVGHPYSLTLHCVTWDNAYGRYFFDFLGKINKPDDKPARQT